MGTHHPIRKHVPEAVPVIPDKLYFRIGDVAKLCEVPAYVLRFWETEFPQLKPNKGGTGQRLYRKKDVEMALRIKSLLYDQGYTIPGARQVFKAEANKTAAPGSEAMAIATPQLAEAPSAMAVVVKPSVSASQQERVIAALRAELQQLHAMLSKPVSEDSAPVEAKVKSMRPRLVLEPKATAVAAKPKPTLQIAQRGLFGFDDDPGPIAS